MAVGRDLDFTWVLGNFQCQGVVLTWLIVGLGPTVLAVAAEGVV